MIVFALTIFAGAFLLFQVQPLIVKYILPWFGGGPAVWTTAMLFFQVFLLCGYAYAHLSIRKLQPRAQGAVHLALLLAALALLPIIPAGGMKPGTIDMPAAQIMLLLLVTIGLPYFVLASTTPLMQAWLGRLRPGVSPYRFFALSNLGSLLALVSYPFVVEPSLARTTQAYVWSWSFGLFALLSGVCAVRTWRLPSAPSTRAAEDILLAQAPTKPTRLTILLWLGLPAAASVLLLAVTNQISQDVAVIPFLWVLPLSVYLLSFIVCFHHERWYHRPLFTGALVPAMATVVWVMFVGVDVPILVQIGVYSGVLFLCSMACHGELARLKPHTRYLTAYYLAIAGGGALGGVFVALIAPLVFRSFLELHVGLVGCCTLVVVALVIDRKFVLRPRWASKPLIAAYWVLVMALGWHAWNSVAYYETADRNFFGVVRTALDWDANYPTSDDYRALYHGAINHGFQYLGVTSSRRPVSYYGPQSGIGLAARLHLRGGRRRIGVIGLGVGTMAAHAREGDEIRFYEINPMVQRAATTLFRYLEESAADWSIVLGDGRLSLEKELRETQGKGLGYDLLVIDAFSGDAPPVHLLTKEAFAIYLAHLAEGGILSINVTNRHIDMSPVVWGLAHEYGLEAVLIENDEDAAQGIYGASWMLVTNNAEWLAEEDVRNAVAQVAANSDRPFDHIRIWTDEYSNVFQLLKD